MSSINTLTRSALLLSTVASAALVSAPAIAQDAGADEARDVITVTARRREETLQDVPMSVTAYSGEELEALGTADITVLNETTPNVTLEVARATNSTLTAFIRGVGQQDPVAGFESGVGIYVDDVYLNRPQGAVLDIYDVERIEVLRGPQGTLYGRNTIGGAVKYVTRRLDPDAPTLDARVNVGSYNQFDQIVTGSIPLSDTFRVGAGFANLRHDGWGENLLTGMDNYNKDVQGYRVSAEWEPSDDFFVRLAWDRVEDGSNPRQGHRLIPDLFPPVEYPVLSHEYDTRAGLMAIQQDAWNEGVSLTMEWQINDNWSVRNILASREDASQSPIDFDSLPVDDLDVPVRYTNDQFSEELLVNYEGDRLAGTMGFYYLEGNAYNIFDVLLGPLGNLISLPGLNAQTLGDVDTETWAVFGNFTYDINDEVSVTLGARYTEDERNSQVLRTTYIGGFSSTFGGAGIPIAVTSDFNGSNSWDSFNPTATIAWQPNAENNLYFTYSQGFKGGGFDPRAQTSATPDFDLSGTVTADEVFSFMSFEPETVDSFEAGWKYQSGNYTHSLSIFHMDYTDIQVPGSVGVDTNGDGVNDTFTGVTTNAGAATIQGIEYEGDLLMASDMFNSGDDLSFSWAIGVLDGEYDEFIDAFGNDISNSVAIQNTPDLTAAGTLTYITPFQGGELAFSNTVSYRGDSQQFERPAPIDQESFTLWNSSIVWDSDDGEWQFGIHGRNLTDERYKVAGYDFVTYTSLGLEGTLTAFYGAPRTVMGTIAWRH